MKLSCLWTLNHLCVSVFQSFGPGSTDRPVRGGAAAVGAGSCSLHLFLQEEVRSLVILKSNTSFALKLLSSS